MSRTLPSPGLRSDPAQFQKFADSHAGTQAPKSCLRRPPPKFGVFFCLGKRAFGAWVSVTFGELLGSAWVSTTFGELLLHWAGSERRPGDGSSDPGHPGSGQHPLNGTSRTLLLPLRLRSSAACSADTPALILALISPY